MTAAGIRPRRAQITMVAGMPGAGKTLWVMWYAAQSKMKGLFFSADSDEHTVKTRAAAMATGNTVEEVEQLMDVYGPAYFNKDLDELMPDLSFVWEPTPTLDDLTLEVLAYEEMHGTSPEVLIIDNLTNIVGDGESWDAVKETFKFLHNLARKSGAAVFVLHHTTEGAAGGRKPPDPRYPQPRRDIQGKVAQLPELILTIGADHQNFRIAPVKNRNGPADATGSTYLELAVDLPRMAIYDSHTELRLAADRRSYS